MNTSSWLKIIKVLEPEYETLKEIMNQGPYIRPLLKYNEPTKQWSVILEEVWPLEDSIPLNSQKLDDSLNWAESELIKWNQVSRINWNSWQFVSKKQAEKFIVIYNLKWSS